MASENFERCLAITLKWEGGYSNHPDDPGGPTMKGIIQREYDAWRRKQGKRPRPVRQIEDDELRAIYQGEYWDVMACDSLGLGLDLCAFDAAVNSGVGDAKKWLEQAQDIDAFCDARLGFLEGLGRLWRVFGTGWRRRVMGIRAEAHAMAQNRPEAASEELHGGMHNEAAGALQKALTNLGYAPGKIDSWFGQKTSQAVVAFQHDHGMPVTGVWTAKEAAVLETAMHAPSSSIAQETAYVR
jgi:lysozyme family protein